MKNRNRLEEERLITKIALLYYDQRQKQKDIAGQLDISQATVSRLLKRAENEGIVRISVSPPIGTFPQLEKDLKVAFGLKDAIVVEESDSDTELLRNLVAAAAFYLESTVRSGETIGISSWSETLLAMADAMHPVEKVRDVRVVQILGGIGNPAAASHATQLTRTLAELVNGEATLLPAPGVVGSGRTRDVLVHDPYVNEAFGLFDTVSLALVGIGSIEPSPVLAQSGNVFPEAGLSKLKSKGAVGDILLRFFDAYGKPVASTWNNRVVGMDLERLQGCRRSVGIAGGSRKVAAILGAIRGSLVNVLVTDEKTARKLIEMFVSRGEADAA
jgi:DNA-binding transcriptional regulator LsrR (DeoR family)